MSLICVLSAPEPPKLFLSTFLLAYFPYSLFCPPVPAFHSRNYGNGTEVITGVEVG